MSANTGDPFVGDDGESCGACLYFSGDGHPNTGMRNRCLRRTPEMLQAGTQFTPPTGQQVPVYDSYFPFTSAGLWCGEGRHGSNPIRRVQDDALHGVETAGTA